MKYTVRGSKVDKRKEVLDFIHVTSDFFEDQGLKRGDVVSLEKFKEFLKEVYPLDSDPEVAIETLRYEYNIRFISSEEASEAARIRKGKKAKNELVAELDAKYEDLLKDPLLFTKINKELDKKIVHEEDSRKALFLILMGGILTTNSSPTSTNVMVNDNAGAGKDHLVKSVLGLIPKNKIINRKRISATVFTYWHNAKYEKGWTWDGKVFYNEDISNEILNSDVFKVMSSSDGINESTVVINQVATDILTVGKPVMVVTIAVANPNPELLRRYPILNLNTSENQTKEIMRRKALMQVRGEKPKYDDNLCHALRLLKRVRVCIPYAELLVDTLDHSNIIIRTHFDRFLDYIKFSAAVHQYQRRHYDEDTILAEERDYEIAREAMIKTTSNIFSIPLTRNRKRILGVLERNKAVWLSVNDLEPHINFLSYKQLVRELNMLCEQGFVEKDKQQQAHSIRPVMVFRMISNYLLRIPKFSELKREDSDSCRDNTRTALRDNTIISGKKVKCPNVNEIYRFSPSPLVFPNYPPQKCVIIKKHNLCPNGKNVSKRENKENWANWIERLLNERITIKTEELLKINNNKENDEEILFTVDNMSKLGKIAQVKNGEWTLIK